MTQKTEKKDNKKKSNMDLWDFQKNPSLVIKGEFGVRRIYSNKSGKFMLIIEGMHKTICIGGASTDGKMVWMGIRPTEEQSGDFPETMVDFSKVYAIVLDGEYKIRRIWGNKKEHWYLIIENIKNLEDSYMIGSSGEEGKNLWMMGIKQERASSEATVEEIDM